MIEVRPLREGEALAASEIEKECLSTAWSEGQIRDRSPETVYLLALVDGVPAGILSASLSLYDGELLNIAVLPDLRGRGVAQALLEELYTRMQGLPELFLEVAESNLPAQDYTKRTDFPW